jgi:hypothetical protein
MQECLENQEGEGEGGIREKEGRPDEGTEGRAEGERTKGQEREHDGGSKS